MYYMDLQDTFISNMRRIRREKKITQEKLAELCETDTSYIGQIETKKRCPSFAFIEKIANSLEISADTLFKPEERQSKKSKSSVFSVPIRELEEGNVTFNSQNSAETLFQKIEDLIDLKLMLLKNDQQINL